MEPKKLYRNPEKGMIGGVCAGLGEYLTADPTIIRLVFILLVLAGMSGVLIYIIMWLIVPANLQGSRSSIESAADQQE